MPVSPRAAYFCGRFRLRISEVVLFLFCFCVLATVTSAQTTPSREYIHLGTRVIAIETPLTFSPPGGAYCASQTVTISSATAGSTIVYTLDGSTPTETHGTQGTSGTSVASVSIGGSSTTLRAIAYKNGVDSPVASATYTITIGPEVVSTPYTPGGPPSVFVGTTVTYTTGGATDCSGNPVSYFFDWGDNTNSGWLPSGTLSASHAWSSTGSMLVKAQARSVTNTSVVSSVSAPWNAFMAVATLQIQSLFADVDPWTLRLSTNLPGTSFNFCGLQTGGQPWCINDYAKTSSVDGSWTLKGNWNDTSVDGDWLEYVTFAGVAGQSNTIRFTVSRPFAHLSISVSERSGTSFHLGDHWTLTMNTNLDSFSFLWCALQTPPGPPGGPLTCTTNTFGSTDENGNWTLGPNIFDPNNPNGSLGSWQEQAQFPGIVNSNTISFTVSQ